MATYISYYLALLVSFGVICATYINPQIDIYVSSLFFVKGKGFIYGESFFPKLVFLVIPIINKFSSIIFAFVYVYALITKKQKLLKIMAYLLVTMGLSLVLIVNSTLKEYVGRARPSDLTEFDNSKKFSRVLEYSNECNHNCSFPSGHAAGAFWLTVIAYFVNKKNFNKVFTFLFALTAIMGFCRIIQGGHFLSDVASAAFIVIFINHTLYNIKFNKV